MYHVSNHLLCVMNLMIFMISIPLIVVSVAVSEATKTECMRVVEQPMLVIGILLLLLSLMGILGCCCRFVTFFRIYLFLLLVLMIGLFCFTVFVYIATDDKVGVAIQDTGFLHSDHVSDYPFWLQNQVGDNHKWTAISNCMREADVCRTSRTPLKLSLFGHTYGVIKRGCCKPPPPCGFKPVNTAAWDGDVNATAWSAEAGVESLEGDCKRWGNDEKILCFGCDTCKAAIIHNLRDGRRRLTAASFFILVILNVVYAVGCCAYQNIILDRYPSRIYHY